MDINRRQLPITVQLDYPDPVSDFRDLDHDLPTAPPLAPENAPNVLLVLFDDMGFGASSPYGGPCRMPVADRLAADGLRFTRFHTTAICAPTRAALLTGRNHHSVGMGSIPENATRSAGYTAKRPDSKATIAYTLKQNGYATGAFGKMHTTPVHDLSAIGPFDRWPTGDGFEKFYGFIGAETNQYRPNLIDGTTRIDQPRSVEDGYHFSEDIVDQAMGWIRQLNTLEPTKPWFAHLSFGAVHDPLQVPAPWREAYEGEFAGGWHELREQILARQIEAGLVPAGTTLSEWEPDIPHWDDLTDDERRIAERLMETYAGMAEHADAQLGRLVELLESTGQLDNTLIFYVLGDNGASAEGGLYGTLNQVLHMNQLTDDPARMIERIDDIGGPDTYAHYPAGWALATNTPYRFAKQVASHYGGTRNGMIVHWPAGIAEPGLRHQWHHCIDVAPTILAAAGIPEPEVCDGVPQEPMEGTDLSYTFTDANAEGRHRTQYFEILGNRGIYHDGWTAVALHKIPWQRGKKLDRFEFDTWELYNVEDDWSQLVDLAEQYPDKLRELQDLFDAECARYNVLPLDDRLNERFVAAIAGRKTLLGDRREVEFRPPFSSMNEDIAPDIRNRDFEVTADVTVASDADGGLSAHGVLVAQGGAFGGWALHVVDGYPCFTYNYAGLTLTQVRSRVPLALGDSQISVRFDRSSAELGAGGSLSLLVNGELVATGELDVTLKFSFSIDEAMDFGEDRGTSVAPDHVSDTSAFTGTLHRVSFVLGEATSRDQRDVLASRLSTH